MEHAQSNPLTSSTVPPGPSAVVHLSSPPFVYAAHQSRARVKRAWLRGMPLAPQQGLGASSNRSYAQLAESRVQVQILSGGRRDVTWEVRADVEEKHPSAHL